MDYTNLIESALKAKGNSYSPYSKFRVGAAVLTKDGKIFTGCNIENAAYTTGICAEKTAFAKAVSDGNKEFLALALVSDSDDYASPCGECRQFISEFVKPDFKVILAKSTNDYKTYDFAELLPLSFKLER